MDLYAYTNIDDLNNIAHQNRILVPRLRGCRLMGSESMAGKTELDAIFKDIEIYACKDMISGFPQWSLRQAWYQYDSHIRYLENYYIEKHADGSERVRWERIHGKKRKALKFVIKKRKKRVLEDYGVFNKYVGCNDVLYVHSRIGADKEAIEEVKKNPRYLDMSIDWYDRTYVTFYFQINPIVEKGGDI